MMKQGCRSKHIIRIACNVFIIFMRILISSWLEASCSFYLIEQLELNLWIERPGSPIKLKLLISSVITKLHECVTLHTIHI